MSGMAVQPRGSVGLRNSPCPSDLWFPGPCAVPPFTPERSPTRYHRRVSGPKLPGGVVHEFPGDLRIDRTREVPHRVPRLVEETIRA
jgi:hypothetical protein